MLSRKQTKSSKKATETFQDLSEDKNKKCQCAHKRCRNLSEEEIKTPKIWSRTIQKSS